MRIAALLIFLGMSATAFAQDDWYNCDVQQFYVLGDQGDLQMKSEGYEGETFRVNRRDGVIVGNKINTIYNLDVVASNPADAGVYSLVNYSRKENGQIRRLSSLTVQDFGESKPFVLAEGNYIFTGLCR